MKSKMKNRMQLALLASGLLAVAGTGCQTTVGGQTMPSAYYLRDDVQYYPAGPEDKLHNARQALEQYKLDRQALQQGLVEELP